MDSRSPMEMEMAALNDAGNKAFADADYKGARGFYMRALRLALSIEREDSICINALNAANSLWMLGKFHDADEVLDILLSEPVMGFPPKYLAEAAYLRAAMRAEEGDAGAAVKWVEASRYFSKQAGKAEPSGTRVVVARALLIEGRHEEALEAASVAVRKAGGNRAEEANALRVEAEANMALNRPIEAIELYERALRLDRGLEMPRKIAQDLMGQGRALEALGKNKAADVMYRRAMSVSEAADERELNDEARSLLNALRGSEMKAADEPEAY